MMVTQLEQSRCPICNEIGTIQVVGTNTGNALSMECVHNNDKTVHKWVESNTSDMAAPRTINPQKIICPKCGKEGRITAFHPTKKPLTYVDYYISHEKIKGTWGKDKQTKRRRCFISKKYRDVVLKKLGRYIEK